MQHDNDNTHMQGTPQLSLQIFSLFQQIMINTQLQQQALQSSLTSFEEAVVLGYIQKLGDPAQGGCKSQGDTSNQLKENPSMPDMCLAKPNLSLTKCNCRSGD